jgi:hypothetical protein
LKSTIIFLLAQEREREREKGEKRWFYSETLSKSKICCARSFLCVIGFKITTQHYQGKKKKKKTKQERNDPEE